jgi:putative methyltransferase (TIGR04325 family)
MTRLEERLLARVGRTPVLGRMARRVYETRFFGRLSRGTAYRRVFRGVYTDFASARASAPPGSTVGHDHPIYAQRVTFARDRIFPSDYPVLFWFAQLLKPSVRVFDWGGNVGITYHAFQRYLRFPDGLKWVVNDVPSVVTAGIQSNLAQAAPGLEFTTNLDALEGADILLAAGSLQFVEEPFASLRQIADLPAHVILNKIPVYEKSEAVTLLNNGTTFVPCHLFNRSSLIASFTNLGYHLVDIWANPDLGCRIPFHPDYSIQFYTGLYLSRDQAALLRPNRLHFPEQHQHIMNLATN